MTASVEVEGLPGVKLVGVVTKVNSFPAEGAWFNSSVKQYETTIDIPEPPAGLRPGMTAQVSIRAEHLDSALQVPLQAVAEIDGCHYCLQKTRDGALVPRPVLLGSSNEKHLVIRQGLADDDELVLDPRSRLSNLEDLPGALVAGESPAAEPATSPTTPTAAETAAAQPASPPDAVARSEGSSPSG
jgi:multidrug efflux pump subunit AcrA (membrane-fusion protein)